MIIISDFGIDVSKWQGDINWQNVKNSGVTFAMIRSGWGKELASQKDKYFEKNYTDAKAVNIPVGTYHYSYADSTNDAILEAKFCLKNIEDKQLEYPVAFDIEDRTLFSLTTKLRTDICKAFCETIENSGYYAMIYCNLDWYKNYLYGDELSKKYDIWLAQWDSSRPSVQCGIWQNSSTGSINGITGNIDTDITYKNYPQIMLKNNLNGFKSKTNYFNYSVVKNDTLWGIAKKFLGDGTKYKEIKYLNNLTSDTIYPNQILKIPK